MLPLLATAACENAPPGRECAACEMLPLEGDIPAACEMLPPEGDISVACKMLPLERKPATCEMPHPGRGFTSHKFHAKINKKITKE